MIKSLIYNMDFLQHKRINIKIKRINLQKTKLTQMILLSRYQQQTQFKIYLQMDTFLTQLKKVPKMKNSQCMNYQNVCQHLEQAKE